MCHGIFTVHHTDSRTPCISGSSAPGTWINAFQRGSTKDCRAVRTGYQHKDEPDGRSVCGTECDQPVKDCCAGCGSIKHYIRGRSVSLRHTGRPKKFYSAVCGFFLYSTVYLITFAIKNRSRNPVKLLYLSGFLKEIAAIYNCLSNIKRGEKECIFIPII